MKQRSPSSFKVVAGQSERRKKSFCGGSSSENDEFLRLSPVIKLKVKIAHAGVTLTPTGLNLTLGLRLRVKPSLDLVLYLKINSLKFSSSLSRFKDYCFDGQPS